MGSVTSIIPIQDEAGLVQRLSVDTLQLIHCTNQIKAIKKLVTAHDIMQLNLEIYQKFSEFKHQFPWDLSTLSDLSQIRRELIVYYRWEFDPTTALDKYSTKLGILLKFAALRNNLTLV